MDVDTRISRDLAKERVSNRAEVSAELPAVLQALEAAGHNDRLADALGALFDHELGQLRRLVDGSKELRADKDLALAALKESADIYKQNFKKIARLMVDDVWSSKKKKALAQYQTGGNLVNGNPKSGVNTFDQYDGLKYADEEKKRLHKIIHGKTTDSIVGQRSSMYNFRAKATDLTKLNEPLPWTKTKV